MWLRSAAGGLARLQDLLALGQPVAPAGRGLALAPLDDRRELEFEVLTGGARADWGETQELVAAREEVTRHDNRINQYLQELEAIGCVFKGFEGGLVDFYSLRDDRPIFLCWRLGEDRISHWHEIDTGFSGRQPIDGAILSATPS